MSLTGRISQKTSLQRLLTRDSQIVVGGLIFVCLASWLYLLAGAGMDMHHMQSTALDAMMTMSLSWTPAYFALLLAMWWVMMVAMMLPSAGPMVMLFAAVNRKSHQQGQPYTQTGFFAAGYLVVWGGFSLAAVGLQWGLEQLALLSPMMQTTSIYLGAALLIGGGVYQLTPLKHACLRRCRSPLQFISQHWRSGSGGAFRMGLEHGLFCLGCCWMLMVLLFYGGVMNLYWIAGLALFVLLEKTTPPGHRLASLSGIGLVAWGVVLLIAVA